MTFQFKNGTLGLIDPLRDYDGWQDWYGAWDRSLGGWVYYER